MLNSGASLISKSIKGYANSKLLSKITTVCSVRAMHTLLPRSGKNPLLKAVDVLVGTSGIGPTIQLIGRRSYSQLHAGIAPSNNPYNVARSTGQWNKHSVQKRTFFTSSADKIKKLTEEADANPHDMEKQAALFKALFKQGKAGYITIIQRFESQGYSNNEDTAKMYMEALDGMGLRDQVSKILLEKNMARAGASQAVQSNAAASAAGAAGGEAGAAPNPTPNPNGGANYQQPPPFIPGFNVFRGKEVPVRIVREWSSYVYSALYPFYWLLIIYVIAKFVISTDKDGSISLFDVPTHHDRAEVIETRFKDVKGCDESKAELEEVVEYLKEPKKFTDIGAALPKGVLLVGEPGTGKTLLARAIAGEANVPFFYCSGSSFDEIFVGVGSKRVRSLFADAKKHAPCIIFIDEIDAIGGRRNKWQTASQDGTLQQLLTELDGFEKNEGVIIIAATNMPDSLDPALVRPGRFDKQVVVPVPDVKGRREIVDLYLSKIKTDADVDSHKIARATPGFTGADLSQLINLAAIKAVTQGKTTVSLSIIEETRDDIWMGRMRKTALVDEKTRTMTAYHEGGHALVSLLTDGSDPVHKATIIQRGQALGVVTHLPEGDQLSLSRKQMMAKIAVAMAGRAAEDVVYGDQEVTSGASSDFNQATKMAYNMVTKWGMSDKVGFVYHIPQERKPSPDTMRQIDGEVKGLLEKQYEYAKDILVTHRKELDALATALLDKETMTDLDGASVKQRRVYRVG